MCDWLTTSGSYKWECDLPICIFCLLPPLFKGNHWGRTKKDESGRFITQEYLQLSSFLFLLYSFVIQLFPSRSVVEETYAGEGHRDAILVAGFDDIVVAY
jgi:hypothetical protein